MNSAQELLAKYKEYLVKTGASPSTIERKLSSVRTYLSFMKAKDYPLVIQSPATGGTKNPEENNLPQRDPSASGLRMTNPRVIQNPVEIKPNQERTITERLEALGIKVPSESLSRNEIPPIWRDFGDKPLRMTNLKKLSQKLSSLRYTIPYALKYNRPKWVIRYQNTKFSRFLNLAVLVIVCVALGVGGYEQFLKRPSKEGKILGTAPIGAPAYLSFQGLLTDTTGTPITSATHFRFMIYNDETASASAKLYEEGKWLDPDTDGIFNTLIGDITAIDPAIYQNNTDLWLGITVGTDPEMTSRQRIASVPYAFNAMYLNGFGVGSTSTGAGINQIPIINGNGVLAISAASPMLQTTSGTFTIQSPILNITTTGNGNISLVPGGTGGVGIGTSSPDRGFKLGVAGNLMVGGTAYFSQNVGIGTSTPSSALHVVGSEYITSGLAVGGTASIGTTLTVGTNLTVGNTGAFGGITVTSQALVSNLNADMLDNLHASSFIQVGNTSSLSGSGTVNYITKWGSTTGLTKSSIFDNGTNLGTMLNVGVGNSSPVTLFNVGSVPSVPTFAVTSNGNVGIGTSSPLNKFYVTGTTGDYLANIYNIGTGSSASGLNIRVDGEGNLLNLNYAGSDIMTVSQASATFNTPTNFTSSGDVSIAYDLNFTNPTSSFIKSDASLTLEAGKSYNSDNLTLRTFNAGNIILESSNLWVDGTNVGIGTTSPASLFDVNSKFNVLSGGNVGIGTTNPTSLFYVAGNGNITGGLNVGGTASVNSTLTVGNNLSVGGSATLPGIIGVTSSALVTNLNADLLDGYHSTSFVQVGNTSSITGSGTTNYITKWGSANGLTKSSIFDNGTNVGTMLNVGIGNSSPLTLFSVGSNPVLPTFAVTSGGNVGIGTTGPAEKLEIAGNTVISTGYLKVANGLIYANTDIAFRNYDGANTTEKMRISGGGDIYLTNINTSIGSAVMTVKTTGNVGIGTTLPTYTLDVVGIINGSLGITSPSATITTIGATNLNVGNTGAFGGITVTSNALVTNLNADLLDSLHSTSFVGTGATGGFVNIGTTGNIIYGSGNINYLPRFNAVRNLTTSSIFDNGTNVGTMLNVGIGNSSPLTLFSVGSTPTAPSLAVTSGGNVGIGTTAPNSKLDIAQVSGGNALRILNSSLSGTIGWDFYPVTKTSTKTDLRIYEYYDTGGAERMVLQAGGNVGIGTTNPLSLLHVAGNGNITGGLAVGGTASINTDLYVGQTGAFGGITVTSNALVSNLNADLLDGSHANAFVGTGATGGFVNVGNTGSIIYGSGNINYLPRFNAVRNLTTSSIFDNGTNVGTMLNVGIGNSSPLTLFSVGSNPVLPSLAVTSGGNVGIGTTGPGYKLDIIGGSNSGFRLKQGAQMAISSPDTTTFYNGLIFETPSTTHAYALGYAVGGYFGINYYDTSSVVNRFIINGSTGNVGIGTTAPSYKLDVVGIINASLGITSPSATITTIGATNLNVGNTGAFGGITVTSNALVTNLNADLLDSLHASSFVQVGNTSSLTGSGTTNYMTRWSSPTNLTTSSIFDNGTNVGTMLNVGIGNSSPLTLFSVGSNPVLPTFAVTSGGNIGIGTTNPATLLQLSGTGQEMLRLTHTGTNEGYMSFFNNTTARGYLGAADAGVLFTGAGADSISLRAQNALHLGGSGDNLTMTLVSGNVGIGTTSPSYKLDVTGIINGSLGITSPSATITTIGATNLNVSGTGAFGGITVTSQALVSNLNADLLDSLHASSFVQVGSTSSLNLTFTNGLTRTANDVHFGGALTEATRLNIGTTEALYISYPNGNVGIGTTNPEAKVEINTGSDFFKGLIIKNYSIGQSANPIEIQSSSGLTQAFVDPTGGISSANARSTMLANTKLQIIGGNAIIEDGSGDNAIKNSRIGLESYDTDEEPFFLFLGRVDGTDNIAMYGGGTSLGNAATQLKFYTASALNTTTGTERMRISSTGGLSFGDSTYLTTNPGAGNAIIQGNVGIGTTSPTEELTMGVSDYIGFESAVGTVDTNLYRGGTNQLKTDDNLVIVGGLAVGGTASVNSTLTVGSNLSVGGSATLPGIIGVTSTAMVTNLNADLLDSLHSTSFVGTGATGGFVGIGTTGNVIYGSGNINYLPRFNAVRNLTTSSIFDNGTNVGTILNVGIGNSSPLALFSVGSNPVLPSFAVTSGGNVGIGTTGPIEKLDVNGAIVSRGGTAGYGTAASETMIDYWATTNIGARLMSFGPDVNTYSPISFYQAKANNTGGRYPLAIDISGNIGIGTISPAALLNIGSTAAQNLFRVDDSGNGDLTPFVINSDGNVGIGTTLPAYTLDVTGIINASLGVTSSSATITTIGATNLNVGNTGAFGGITVTSNALVTNLNADYLDGYHSTSFVGTGATGGFVNIGNTGSIIYGSGTTNYLPRFNAVRNLTTSSIFDNGTNVGTMLNVGIGNSSPLTLFNVGSNPAAPTFAVTSGGNVGIGTTNPKSLLGIGQNYSLTLDRQNNQGDAFFFHNAYYGTGTVADGNLQMKATTTHASFGTRGIVYSFNPTNSGILFFADNAATTADTALTPTERMRITNTGNVGIGTTNPLYKLDVTGIANISLGLTSPSATITTIGTTNINVGNTGAFGGITVTSNALVTNLNADMLDSLHASSFVQVGNTSSITGSGTTNYITKWGSTSGLTKSSIFDNGTNIGTMLNVGIGNSSPLTLFSVGSNPVLPTFAVTSGGNVGIGTTAPQTKLHINGGSAAAAESARLSSTPGGNGQGPLLRFTAYNAGGLVPNAGEYNIAGIQGVQDSTGNWGGDLYFQTAPTGTVGGAALTTKMTILAGGNVGIGTSNPSLGKLQVEGVNQAFGVNDSANLLVYSTNAHAMDMGGAIGLGGVDTVGGRATFALIKGAQELNENQGYLAFGTRTNAVNATERMRITSTGNVGIGITGPTSTLHVVGNAYITNAMNVGVGLTAGALNVTNNLVVGKTGAFGGITITSSALVTNLNADLLDGLHSASFVQVGNTSSLSGSGTVNYITKWGSTTGLTKSSIFDNGTNVGTMLNVGIGNSSPLTLFNVGSNPVLPSFAVTSGGNVGIGTTSPGATLEVINPVGSETAGSNLIQTLSVSTTQKFGYRYNSDGSKLIFDRLYGGAWSPVMTFNRADGNVGIGTTNPGAKLETLSTTEQFRLTYDASNYTSFTVANDGNLTIAPIGAGNDTVLSLNHLNVGYGVWVGQSVFGNRSYGMTYDQLGTRLGLYAGGSEYVSVKSTGNVGIGTTNPNVPLEFATTAVEKIRLWSDGTVGNSMGLGVKSGLMTFESNTAGGFQFITGGYSGTDLLRIKSDGNVGIGTTNPLYKLDVTGIANISLGLTSPSATITTIGTTNLNVGGTAAIGGMTISSSSLVTNLNADYLDGLHSTSFIQVGNTSSLSGSGTTNYITKWGSASGLTNSSLFDNGTNVGTMLNVGIGNSSPLTLFSVGSTPTAPSLAVTSGGNVGIGTTNPFALFQVGQGPDVSGNYTVITSNGNVGIGTTNPNIAKLQIIQSTGAEAFYVQANRPSGNNTAFDILANGSGATSNIAGSFAAASGTKNVAIEITNPSVGDENYAIYSGVTAKTYLNGNLGIGTTAPTSLLHVVGNSRITGGLAVGGTASVNSTLTVGSNLSVGGSATLPGIIGVTSTALVTNLNADYLDGLHSTSFVQVGNTSSITGSGTTNYITKWSSATNLAVSKIFDNGTNIGFATNVGIGNSSPLYALDVTGIINASLGITSPSATITTIGTTNLNVGNTGAFGGITVTSNSLVTNLNADLLDGLHSTSFVQVGNTSSITGSGTTNYITRWSSSTNLATSSIFDNGTNIGTMLNVGIGNSSPLTLFNVGSNPAVPTFNVTSGGNVGIGTTSPGAKLDTDGRIRIRGNTLPTSGIGLELGYYATGNAGVILAYDRDNTQYKGLIYDATQHNFRIGGNEKVIIDTSGNVGIGTTNPLYKLDVVGIINGSLGITSPSATITTIGATNLNVGNTGAFGGITVTSNALVTNLNADLLDSLHASTFVQVGSTSSLNLTFTNGLTRTANDVHLGGALTEATRLNIGTTEALYISYPNGNVGIGITNPGGKLDIKISPAQSTIENAIQITNDQGLAYSRPAINWYNSAGSLSTARIYSEAGAGYGASKLFFETADSNKILQTRMVIDTSGNVGIETVSPTALLNIGSTAAQDLFRVDDNGSGDLSPFIINSDGNVGIGTTPSIHKLEVSGTVMFAEGADQNIRFGSVYSNPYIATYNSALSAFVPMQLFASKYAFNTGNVGIGTTGPEMKLHVSGGNFKLTNTGGNPTMQYQGAGDSYFTYWNNTNSYFGFQNSSSVDQMVIKSGNVGIGTTNPLYKLDVVGIINASLGLTSPSATITTIGATNLNVGGTAAIGGMTISSSSLVTNLNADYLDGLHSTSFVQVGNTSSITGSGTTNYMTRWSSATNLTTSSIFDNGTNIGTMLNVGIGNSSPLGLLMIGSGIGGTTPLIVTANGNVGIGTTGPVTNLHIGGGGQTMTQAGYGGIYVNPSTNTAQMTVENNGGIEGGFFTHPSGAMYFGTWSNHPLLFTTNNTEYMRLTATGNFGIGTTAPGYALDVQKTAATAGIINLGVDTGYSYYRLARGGVFRGAFGVDSGGQIVTEGAANDVVLRSDSNLLFGAGGANEKMRLTSTGNVGIGNSAPLYKLDVTGIINASLGITSPSATITTIGTTNLNVGGTAAIGGMTISSSSLVTNLNADLLDGYHSTSFVGTGATGGFVNIGNTGSIIYGSGTTNYLSRFNATRSLTTSSIFDNGTNIGTMLNVGIGNSSPLTLFSVGSTPSAPTLAVTSGGNVGIGTTGPLGKLDIRPDSSWLTTSAIIASAVSDDPSLRIYRPSGNGTTAYPWYMRVGDAGPGTLDFATGSLAAIGSESVSSKMVINSSGNVGIGTTAPTSLLHVVGNGNITGGLAIGGTASINSTLTVGSNLSVGGSATLPGIIGVTSTALVTNLNADMLDGLHSTSFIQIGNTSSLSGSGTVNYITKWGSTTGLTKSSIFDNGTNVGFSTNVGIGTSSPVYALDIVGGLRTSLGITAPNITLTTGAGDGKILRSDASGNTVWSTLAAGAGIGITNVSGTITIHNLGGGGAALSGGTTNYVTKWSNSTTVATSSIFDNGTNIGTMLNVGIGNSSPLTLFNVGSNPAAPTFNVTSGGNVGIGTTNPQAILQVMATGTSTAISATGKLDVLGITLSANDYLARIRASLQAPDVRSFLLAVGDANTTGWEKFVVKGSGNVGIGTTMPASLLHVAGNTNITGGLAVGGTASINTNLYVGQTGAFGGITVTSNALVTNLNADLLDGYHSTSFVGTGATAGFMGLGNTGNFVGVGTTGGIIYGSGNINYLSRWNANRSLTTSSIFDNGTNVGFSTNVGIGNSSPLTLFSVGSNPAVPTFAITSSGNIGIGTTNPQATLEIAGASQIEASSGTLSLTASAANGKIYFLTGGTGNPGNVRTVIDSNGNVGIGTTSPGEILYITAGRAVATLESTNSTIGSAYRAQSNTSLTLDMGIYGTGTTGTIFGNPRINTAFVYSGGSAPGGNTLVVGTYYNDPLIFGTSNLERMRILSGGNVGIGTTNPTYALDVTGMIRTTLGITTPSISGITSTGLVTNLNADLLDGLHSSAFVQVGSSSPISGSGTQNYITKWNNSSNLTTSKIFDNGTNVGIVPTGNIGIGTSSPVAFFQVNQGIGGSTGIFAITSTGNVGIGTTNPQYLLDIKGNTTITGGDLRLNNRQILNPEGTSTINLSNVVASVTSLLNGAWSVDNGAAGNSNSSTPALSVLQEYGTLGGTAPANGLVFMANASGRPQFGITNTGNVGIGTSNPGAPLHIQQSSGNGLRFMRTGYSSYFDERFTSNGTNDLLAFDASPDGIGNTINYNILNITSDGAVGINGYTRVIGGKFAVNGNVGIGTSGPTAPLSVVTNNSNLLSLVRIQNLSVGNSAGSGAYFINDLGDRGLQMGVINSATNMFPGYGQPSDTYIYSSQFTRSLNIMAAGVGSSSNINFFVGSNAQVPADMVIDNSGNVGIGTTNPTNLLQLSGTGQEIFRLTNTGANDSYMSFYNSATARGFFGAGDSGTLFTGAGPDSISLRAQNALHLGGSGDNLTMTLVNGNVGIGTTNPIGTLDVVKNSNAVNGLYVQNSTADTAAREMVLVGEDTSTKWGSIQHLNTSYTTSGLLIPNSVFVNSADTAGLSLIAQNASGVIRFATAGYAQANERMRIDATGNVGVGTTSPGAKLDITHSGTGAFALIAGADVNADSRTNSTRKYVRIGLPHYTNTEEPVLLLAGDSDGTDNYVSMGGSTSYGNAATTLRFYTAATTTTVTGTERMRIASDGNVGIGTTSPQRKLHIIDTDGSVIQLSDTTAGTTSSDGINLALLTTSVDAQLWNFENGYLRFGTNNSEQMRISATGNVGMGTTNPSSALHVEKSLSSEYVGRFINTHTTDGYGVIIKAGDSDTENVLTLQDKNGNLLNRFYSAGKVYMSGNVGIGTSSPSYLLDIKGNEGTYLTSLYNLGTGSTAGGLYIRSDGEADLLTLNYAGSDIVEINQAQSTFNNPANFTASGDVSAAYDLNFTNSTSSYIKSAAPLYIQAGEQFNSSDLTLKTFNQGNIILDSANLWADGTNVGIGTTNPLGMFMVGSGLGGTTPFIIKSNGNVGIGMTNPLANLDIKTAAGFTRALKIGPQTTTIGDGAYIEFTSSSTDAYGAQIGGIREAASGYNALVFRTGANAQAERMRISNGGNVGIGTTNPFGLFQVGSLHSGNTAGVIITSVGNVGIGTSIPAYKLQLSSDSAAKPNGGTWTSSSDSRLKTNIHTIDNALDKMLSLEGVSFKWINPEEHGGLATERIGLIAQNVEKVFPEWVGEVNPAGRDAELTNGQNAKTLTIFGFEALTAEAFRQQQIQISSLSAQIKLTDQGEVNLNLPETSYSGVFEENSLSSAYTNYLGNISNQANEKITKIGQFAEVLSAKIKTGFLETTNLIAKNIFAEKIASPSIETKEISSSIDNPNIDFVSPAGEKTMAIETDKKVVSYFGELLMKDKENNVTASIDTEGNASFSGSLSVSDLSNLGDLNVAGDATVSGELTTNELVADSARIRHLKAESIEGLEALIATISAQNIKTENISGLENSVIASDSEAIPSETEISTSSAWLTDQANSWPIVDPSNDIEITTNVRILGVTSLAQTIISGPLTQDGTLILDEGNSINSLSGTLYIQNKGMGGIDLLAGKVTIDVSGNAVFEGNLTVKGTLAVNEIKSSSKDLTFNLSPLSNLSDLSNPTDLNSTASAETTSGFGKLLAIGEKDQTVFSLNASGSAQFAGDIEASGSARIAQLNIQRSGNVLAAGADGILETTASAGEASILTGASEITIKSPFVAEKSLVYLTPIGSTNNQVVYLKIINPEEKTFTIAIDEITTKEIRFNWWIIN